MKQYDLVVFKNCYYVILKIDEDLACAKIKKLELTGCLAVEKQKFIKLEELATDNEVIPVWNAAYEVWRGSKISAKKLNENKKEKILELISVKYNLTVETIKKILNDVEILGYYE